MPDMRSQPLHHLDSGLTGLSKCLNENSESTRNSGIDQKKLTVQLSCTASSGWTDWRGMQFEIGVLSLLESSETEKSFLL